jgi:microcystin-dependent protein
MQPFIGQITVFPFNFAPVGWALCEGQLMPISQNTALFSLLGTFYGGDGRTTFALPDLRGRVPIGQARGQGSPRMRSARCWAGRRSRCPARKSHRTRIRSQPSPPRRRRTSQTAPCLPKDTARGAARFP